jgi:chaperone required for assembly of F1-ATPase
MIAATVKRFYKDVSVVERNVAFDVLLDGKLIKTPRRNSLSVPTRALGEAVATEWRAQHDEVKPLSMPLNRLASTAIDRGAHEREGIVADVLHYARGDLLCYRAEETELAERQRVAWDPLLDWLDETHRARLQVTAGVTHIVQPQDALERLADVVRAQDPFALTALHAAATITASSALALALLGGRINAAQAFALSQIDETYQIEKWGVDHAAAERARNLGRELDFAAEFAVLSRT